MLPHRLPIWHAMKSLRFLLLLPCLFAQSLLAAAPELEIQWFHPDFPPYFILKGHYAGRGTADQIEAFLAREMPQYQHSQVQANLLRREAEIKLRKLACSSAVLKTPEREQSMLFSASLISILPNGLTILRSQEAQMQPFINARGELRLAQWLLSAQYKLSAAAGRSFGPQIDAMLQPQSHARQVERFKASDTFASGLLQMMNRQGVDGVLGYAVELSWTVRRLGLSPEAFRFLPIEGATQLLPSYFGCSKSPQAAAVIEQVNALIDSGALQEVARRAYVEWLPADAAEHFESLRKAESRR